MSTQQKHPFRSWLLFFVLVVTCAGASNDAAVFYEGMKSALESAKETDDLSERYQRLLLAEEYRKHILDEFPNSMQSALVVAGDPVASELGDLLHETARKYERFADSERERLAALYEDKKRELSQLLSSLTPRAGDEQWKKILMLRDELKQITSNEFSMVDSIAKDLEPIENAAAGFATLLLEGHERELAVLWAKRKYLLYDSITDAPEYLYEEDFCPYCEVDGDWKTLAEVPIYNTYPRKTDDSAFKGQPRGVLPKNVWVKPLKGTLVSKRRDAWVRGSDREPNNEVGAPALYDGEIIHAYAYLGDGCTRLRKGSSSWVSCGYRKGFEIIPSPKADIEWWVQVRGQQGKVLWVEYDHDKFISQGGLNDELASAIMKEQGSIEQKLEAIDELILQGAQMNGYGSKHGLSPSFAIAGLKDVSLIEALIERGFEVNHEKGCFAANLRQNLIEPGGPEVLDFFLSQGMPLDCLREPPVHSFLGWGIKSKSYSNEIALEVARVLYARGYGLMERNGKGTTIIEVLQRSGMAERKKLIQELESLAAEQTPGVAGENLPDSTSTGSSTADPQRSDRDSEAQRSAARGDPAKTANGEAQSSRTQDVVVDDETRQKAYAALRGKVAEIQHKIKRNWTRPAGSDPNLSVTVGVEVDKSGHVRAVDVAKSSGSQIFDDSAVSAIKRASPLPFPAEEEFYEYISRFRFSFRPG